VLGVSVDSWASAGVFQDQVCTDIPLLSDFPKNQASRDYGVYNEETGNCRRVTFVIDKDRKVRGWYESREAETHPEEALRVLESIG
jgi:peroxiredoxin